ncbi:hypothetical protein ACFX1R_003267 [Malus domestica]
MTQAPEEPIVNPTIAYSFYPTYEEILDYRSVIEETNPSPKNRNILVYYAGLDDVWCRNEMIIDEALAYAVATEIMLSDNIEPVSLMNVDVEPIGQTGNKQSKSNSIRLRSVRCLDLELILLYMCSPLATSGFSFGSVMIRPKLCVTKLVLLCKVSNKAPILTMMKLIHLLWM